MMALRGSSVAPCSFLLLVILGALVVPSATERPAPTNSEHQGDFRGDSKPVKSRRKLRKQSQIVAKAHGKGNKAQLDLIDAHGGHKSEQAPTTTTENESWLSRMGDSIWEFFFGIVLILFSIPVMWFNERRTARMDALIVVGESECVSVTRAETANDGALVHVAGSDAHAKKPVVSPWFDEAAFDSGCIRLRNTVEVYQWIEHKEETERKNSLGGGTTRTTNYSYTKEWSSSRNDSSNFKDTRKQNKFPINPGVITQNCSLVEVGEGDEGFLVPDEMVSQLTNFSSAHSRLGDTVTSRAGGELNFAKGERFFVYGSGKEIGDVRVKFEMVRDGPVTIVALQTMEANRHTFLPYRPIHRGFCCFGVSEEEQRTRLLREAQKTQDELAEADACSCGPLNLCCCCCLSICNLVSKFFSQLLTPQLYHMFSGERKVAASFAAIGTQNKVMAWTIRLLGWLMLFAGTYGLFSPLLVMIDIIPFLGPFVSTLGSYAIWGICFLVTLVLATLVISIAYLLYRPLLGMLYLGIATAAAGIIIAISSGAIAMPA